MSNSVIFVADPGHGGLINGKYVTPGKRSPKPIGTTPLYEGVNNRDNVNRFLTACKFAGLDAVDIVSTNEDISLPTRTDRINALNAKRKTMTISFHSDAAMGGDTAWIPGARGITVYTSPNQTPSDKFAEILVTNFEKNMSHLTTIRKDTTDGDKDKEAKFWMLTETIGDSVLIEGGFHTNEAEATLMLTDEWKALYIKSIVDACKTWEAAN